jgi:hypothetical protein
MLTLGSASIYCHAYSQGGVSVTRQLVSVPAWVPVDTFFQSSSQASASVALSAGQPILLEGAHCNGGGPGQFQVGAFAAAGGSGPCAAFVALPTRQLHLRLLHGRQLQLLRVL